MDAANDDLKTNQRTSFKQKLVLVIVASTIISIGIIAGRFVEAWYIVRKVEYYEQKKAEQYKVVSDAVKEHFDGMAAKCENHQHIKESDREDTLSRIERMAEQ